MKRGKLQCWHINILQCLWPNFTTRNAALKRPLMKSMWIFFTLQYDILYLVSARVHMFRGSDVHSVAWCYVHTYRRATVITVRVWTACCPNCPKQGRIDNHGSGSQTGHDGHHHIGDSLDRKGIKAHTKESNLRLELTSSITVFLLPAPTPRPPATQ